jgi:hypothetical protein
LITVIIVSGDDNEHLCLAGASLRLKEIMWAMAKGLHDEGRVGSFDKVR